MFHNDYVPLATPSASPLCRAFGIATIALLWVLLFGGIMASIFLANVIGSFVTVCIVHCLRHADD